MNIGKYLEVHCTFRSNDVINVLISENKFLKNKADFMTTNVEAKLLKYVHFPRRIRPNDRGKTDLNLSAAILISFHPWMS